MNKSIIAILGICASVVGAARAADLPIQEVEANCSLDVEFPISHIKWARPYGPGSLRLLFFGGYIPGTNTGGTRPAVEILQRFGFEADAVLIEKSGLHGGKTGEQRLARLLETSYDCYVVKADGLASIPDPYRATIIGRVKQGAGLMMYHLTDEDKSLLGELKQLPESPVFFTDMNATAYTVGKGRLAVQKGRKGHPWTLAAPGPKDRVFGVALRRDLRTETEGRAILWAARQKPKVELAISLPEHSQDRRIPVFPRDRLGDGSITATWKNGDVQRPLTLHTRILSRSRGGSELPPRNLVKAAAGSESFKMPVLPGGTYWWYASAVSDRGVEGWAVKEFEVSAGEHPGNIKLSREWGEAGRPIRGTVDVHSADRDQRTLHVQAIDRYGRVLSRQEFPKPEKTETFSLSTESQMPNYLGIEAVLMDADEATSYAYAKEAYTIPKRRQDDWHLVMWGRLYAQPLDIVDDMLAHAGITSRIETTNIPWWQMSRAGMNYVPYCASGLQRQHFRGGERLPIIPLDDDGVLKSGCWNDEPAVTDRLRKWLGDENDYKRHGVLAYSMGDEVNTLGSCLHASCMNAYRNYLKNQYETVAALNASWGTDFQDFGEVGLSEPGDNLEEAAFKQKNYPRWFDRRAFQSWNFANYCKRFGAAAEQIDPHAISGPEGTGWLDDDLDLIVRSSKWWIIYSLPAAEIVRSVAPRDYRYGHWIGYSTENPKNVLSDFWLSFLRGANCIGYHRGDDFFGPNLEPSILGSKEMIQTGRIVFDGLGTLLNIESDMQHDGVAMLHSFASAQATNIDPGLSYGTYSGWITNSESDSPRGLDWALKPQGKNHLVWHRAIRAVGLQFEYVTDRMIQRGEFDPDQFKVLILSQHEAIGAMEADVIRKFARNGGTVIADVRPGLYNDHCKRRDGGALDDLFGVRHTANVPAVAVPGRMAVPPGGLDVEVIGMQVNPAVELTTGKAMGMAGETPIYIVNKVGNGQAILLNFPMCSFSNLSLPETPEADAELLANIFESAGVKWPMRLINREGHRKRNTEAVRWETGKGIEVVAVYGPIHDGRSQWRPKKGLIERIRAVDVPTPMRIKLPKARNVTVIGSDHSFGSVDEFTIDTRPWQPVFVVLSERPLQGPVLDPGLQIVAPGQTLKFTVSVPDPQGRHALKVRVTSPDGAAAKWFDQSMIVGDEPVELSLALAHNETPGTWTVEVVDLYNGKKAVARFEVRPEEEPASTQNEPSLRHADDIHGPDQPDALGWNPLQMAVREGRTETIEQLIDKGEDVNAMDRWGWSPLCAAVEADQIKAMEVLLAGGADVNARNKNDWTACNLAARLGRMNAVQLLLANGADIHATNRWKTSALHSAVRHRYQDIAISLLNHGAWPDATDANGKTPRELADNYNFEWKMIFRDHLGVVPQRWVFRADPDKVGEAEQWYLTSIPNDEWRSVSTQMFWTHQEYPGNWHGTGWYRVDFALTDIGIDPQRVSEAKKVAIAFGAIDGTPKVWLNGTLVGTREGYDAAKVWNVSWSVDVTNVIKSHGINQLTVSCTKENHAAGIHPGKDKQPVRLVLQ